MRSCVLKAVPEDFTVTECLGLPTGRAADRDYQYLLLRKRGYTTHEAMSALAAHLGVPPDAVAAAGLKDDDGVTEQYLSLRGPVSDGRLRAFSAGIGDDHHWLRLTAHGYGPEPLRAGDLDGNCFRVVARALDPGTAGTLREGPARRTLFFVNYYGTQRFGVPGGPKETHLLGEALLRGDDATAFALLRRSGSPEGRLAQGHRGSPARFLAGLDPRVPVFYRCSYASYQWNGLLRDQVERAADGRTVDEEDDGIPYTFPTTAEAAVAVLARCPVLDLDRYRWAAGTIRHDRAPRPTVVQTQLRIDGVAPDELHPGRWRCRLSFFLPSGCYATTAVRQFLLQREDGREPPVSGPRRPPAGPRSRPRHPGRGAPWSSGAPGPAGRPR
ncbi:tRNA pseudouridine(13) synthase TruD [Streptomyces hesseae]|uniref:tRNA pseudouridine(13) synthase TruD n=1 Tax=Streptomyces hesseae TaxID=3075519 RepID=A0ABU2SFG8_9ACTN|nr:tRNA pseudouridine(13) synthase TruD [Streptomyces sp. DSM 40473]MDT0447731.1 tRNA pseudouridine(13) synthase TruD [Streptomyces sp. DSM 40473]